MKMPTFLLCLLLALPGLAGAAAPVVARVTHLSGLLTAQHAEGGTKILSVQSEILLGDTLSTEKDTYARIKFSDEAEVVLRPGTRLGVASYAYDPAKPKQDSSVLSLFKGGMRAVTGLIGKRNKEAVNFNTPTATIGIRGTHFGALFCHEDCEDVPTVNGEAPADGLHIDVSLGAVFVQNDGGGRLFSAGEFGFVRDKTSIPVIVPTESGVQVGMPAKISQNAGARAIGMSDDPSCLAR